MFHNGVQINNQPTLSVEMLECIQAKVSFWFVNLDPPKLTAFSLFWSSRFNNFCCMANILSRMCLVESADKPGWMDGVLTKFVTFMLMELISFCSEVKSFYWGWELLSCLLKRDSIQYYSERGFKLFRSLSDLSPTTLANKWVLVYNVLVVCEILEAEVLKRSWREYQMPAISSTPISKVRTISIIAGTMVHLNHGASSDREVTRTTTT